MIQAINNDEGKAYQYQGIIVYGTDQIEGGRPAVFQELKDLFGLIENSNEKFKVHHGDGSTGKLHCLK